MTDRIRVAVGSQPWRPDPDTTLDRVIQRNTIPLIGLVTQDGVQYVFWCAMGHALEANLWLYSILTPGDGERIVSARSPEELATTLREVTNRRAEIVALAANDDQVRGIVLTAPLDHGIGFGDDLTPAIKAIQERLREVNHAAEVASVQELETV